jgi:Ca2+-binding EF-hand superfamily protein
LWWLVLLFCPGQINDTVYAPVTVAFRIYDLKDDGFIDKDEFFAVLKMMVQNNIPTAQLLQIVDKTITEADRDGDGRLSLEEFETVLQSTDVNGRMSIAF